MLRADTESATLAQEAPAISLLDGYAVRDFDLLHTVRKIRDETSIDPKYADHTRTMAPKASGAGTSSTEKSPLYDLHK